VTRTTGAEAARTEATPDSLADRLSELDATLAEARERRSEASTRRRWRARAGVGKQVTDELREYVDGVRFSKREQDLDEHRRLTKEFCDRVQAEGLVLDPDNQGMIRVLDPKLETEERDANRALVAAKQERAAFLAENAEKIEAERLVAESQEFREATEAGDVETVKRILEARAVQPHSTVTSDDLATTNAG
jgi:hypothetical protein